MLVALLPAERAVAEWERLRARPEFAGLWSSDTTQLLPLVGRALVQAGVDDPDLPRLRQVVRRTWVVLHTSGTTSRPKLVPLTHANLVASARNVAQGF